MLMVQKLVRTWRKRVAAAERTAECALVPCRETLNGSKGLGGGWAGVCQ